MAPTYQILDPLALVPSRPEDASSSSSDALASSSSTNNPFTVEQASHFIRRSEVSGLLETRSTINNLHHSYKRSLAPDSTQKVTLGVIGAYVGIIAILWNFPFLKWILYPFKMLTIAFHEFSHAGTGCCTGASIKSISLDPREGGVTMMAGGASWITLPAGYLGSSIIGALLIFCGFDIVASKVASFVLAAMFLVTLWWARRDWLTIITILLAVGLLIACWFIAHSAALRFFVLFIGTMSSLYSTFDIFDDLILRKVNESDASVFAKRYGGSSQCWGLIWAVASLCFMAIGIIGGLAAFKQSFSQQATDSANFIPTMF